LFFLLRADGAAAWGEFLVARQGLRDEFIFRPEGSEDLIVKPVGAKLKLLLLS
jgi:hypothetical protein